MLQYKDYSYLLVAVVLLTLSTPISGMATEDDGTVKPKNQAPTTQQDPARSKAITKKTAKQKTDPPTKRTEKEIPGPIPTTSLQEAEPVTKNSRVTVRQAPDGNKTIARSTSALQTPMTQNSRTIDRQRQTRTLREQPTERKRIEPYVAVFGGINLAQPLTNVHGLQDLSSVHLSDLDLARSPIYGVKAGLFLPSPQSWFGLETEVFYSNPHVKQQPVTATGSKSGTDSLGGAHIRMTTWAFNWVARYPGERFQPYAGVGLGIFWARLSGNDYGGSGSDTSLGLNALAGVRLLVTRHIGLFAEYKYNRASFDLGGDVMLHTLYQAHNLVGGLSVHF